MKLKTIVLSDFLSFQDEEIQFPEGLVAISGRNADSPGAGSNGSGKSALFDAVSWALYGRTLREIGSDDVIRMACKSCEVALSFTADGKDYFINRQRGGKNLLHFFCGQNDLTQSTMALTQEKIDQTLGMDYKIFRAVATFSGDALRFAHATDKEQKEILEKLLGLDAYGLALERVRKDLNALVPGIKYKEQQVEREKGLLQTRRDEIVRLGGEKDKASSDMALAVESAKVQCEARQKQIATNESGITGYKEHRTKFESQLADVSTGTSAAYGHLATARAEYAAAMTKMRAAKESIDKGNGELANIQKRIGTPCPSCARPLGQEHIDPLCESIAQRILDANDEWEKADGALKAAEQRVNGLAAEVEALQRADSERAAARGALLQNIKTCNAKIEELNRSTTSLRAEIEQFRRSGDQFKATISTYEARIKDAQARLDEAESQIQKSTEDLVSDRDRVKYLEFWEKGFGYSGIRSMLLDGVAQKLTEQTNKYLKILSGGTQWAEFATQSTTGAGELREKFIVHVFNAYGAGAYEGNSAGEKKRVDIAICLALHSLASQRASRPLGFAILDEIFENLDEIGCDNVINLIRQEKDQLGTIFVVSHNPALSARFPSTMEIIKKDGVSRLVRHEKAAPECATTKPTSTTTPKAKSSSRTRKAKSPKSTEPSERASATS